MSRTTKPTAEVTSVRSPRIALEAARARLSRALLRADIAAQELQQTAKRFDTQSITGAVGMAQSIECRLRSARNDLTKISGTETLPEFAITRKTRLSRETIKRVVVRGTAA